MAGCFHMFCTFIRLGRQEAMSHWEIGHDNYIQVSVLSPIDSADIAKMRNIYLSETLKCHFKNEPQFLFDKKSE